MVTVIRHGGPLIGRTRELAALRDAAASARGGRATAVVLAGDAGVGKSRLVGELLGGLSAEGFRCLLGRSVNLPDGGVPYLPLVDALRTVESDVWQRIEPHLRGTAERPLSQLQIYDAVVELLSELAAQSPLCLVLEDIHWSDPSTRDLLRYLFGRMDTERLMVLLTYRADDVDRRHPLRPFLAEIARMPSVQRVVVDPLPPEGIAELVRAEGSVAAVVVDDIVSRADGNAFFAEELRDAALADIARHRPADSAPFALPDALPDALLDVLIARLEQLDRRAAMVVGVAAVAGRRVGHDVLAAVTGMGEMELEEALREAVTAHVLVPDPDAPAYEFRHALMQEAAYAELLPGERVRTHRAYAQVLSAELVENPAAAAELAYHAELSLDVPLALGASVNAGLHALAVHAPSEAQRHFERALAWWCAVPDAEVVAGRSELDVHQLAAQAAAAAGDPARAVVLLQAADQLADRSGDTELRVAVRATLAAARYHAGDPRAEATSAEALALAQQLGPSSARAQARSTRAVVLFFTNAPGVAEMATLALSDAEEIGAANLQAEALITLARLAEQGDQPDRAEQYFTRALALARDSGDVAAELRTLFNLAVSRADRGDLAQSQEWTARSIARAAETGMTDSEYAKITRGIDYSLRYMIGDWDAIAADQEAKLPAAARISRAVATAAVATARGEARAVPLVDSRPGARELSRRAASQIHALEAIFAIERACWRGDVDGAAQQFRSQRRVPIEEWGGEYLERIWLIAAGISALADLAGVARLKGDAAAVDAAVADGELAIADIRASMAHACATSSRLAADMTAWSARAEAELSRLRADSDPAPWRSALAAFSFGYRYEVARCRWRLAEALIEQSQGSEREGVGLLEAAHATALELGAKPLATAIEALARRAKIPGIGAAGAASVLTAREAEVVALLALGRTNRQIGAALFISEKTASVHVSNLLAKLRAATRGEAVAQARARGLL